MSSSRVFVLKCAYQTYAWGKEGSNSEVAQLLQSSDDKFIPSEQTAYAELWMGTHPKGPSIIEQTGKTLEEWIQQHPDSLGQRVSIDKQLPFLFKVLSVNIALSIQVHPDKPTAERLHKSSPTLYVDDNHKPEMAIALSPFEALCGFRPRAEIVSFLNVVDELRHIVGAQLCDRLKENGDSEALRDCFSALMSCEPTTVEKQLNALVDRLKNAKSNNDTATLSSCLADLVLRLYEQFPGDVGCFCVYFLNHVVLKPGQAVFLKANLPHAYLSGDCIECMACSDNVVRAGLTPKFKDVSTLCSILEYTYQSVSEILFPSLPDPIDNFSTLYDPPVSEFSIARIELPAGLLNYSVTPLDGASIIIVFRGSARADNPTLGEHSITIKRGSVLFVASNESVSLTVLSHDNGLLLFRAFCV